MLSLQLMPLLLRGLTLPDPTLRAGVIDTLLSAAQADIEAETMTAKEGNVISEHAVSLSNAMLQNSVVAEMPDTVRASIAVLSPSLSTCLPFFMSWNRGCALVRSSTSRYFRRLCGMVFSTRRRWWCYASSQKRWMILSVWCVRKLSTRGPSGFP